MQPPTTQAPATTAPLPTAAAQPPEVPQPRAYLSGALVVLCLGFFVAIQSTLRTGTHGTDEWGALARWGLRSGFEIWEGAYWAVLVSAVLHLEFWHLAFNLYWLWVFGALLERALGARPLLIVVLLAAWVSSLVEMAATDGTGIGMSGVIYALFGMAIPLRSRHPMIKTGLSVKTIGWFLVWLVGCVVVTVVADAPIGNAAHASGLLCGLIAGFWFRAEHLRRPATAALAVMTVATSLVLAWCPWSPTWAGVQGMRAYKSEDYPTAITWYLRSIELGGDPVWGRECVAYAHVATGDRAAFIENVAKLRAIDARAADELEREYGDSFPEAQDTDPGTSERRDADRTTAPP